ncbi:MAG: NHL repeat-containing protein [Candidatus Sericytochromatia bacterium]|nr:NHL repeat-containing protein [Candidatus Sericytochromatia bacterium]
MSYPDAVAVGPGGLLYIADAGNSAIRLLNEDGVLVTVAGSGSAGYINAYGRAARFSGPRGLAFDAAGNLYVADTGNHRIRKISTDGFVDTVAGTGEAGFEDGPAHLAKFNSPSGVAVDASGTLYVADGENHCVRRLSTAGTVSTVAGDGTAGFADAVSTAARFNSPYQLALDASGVIYVTEIGGRRVRKVQPDGTVTTLAGDGEPGNIDGSGPFARFEFPWGIAVNASGTLFVADSQARLIRRISPTGLVTTVAGSGGSTALDGAGLSAQFSEPRGLAVDDSGAVFVADRGSHRIRKMAPDTSVTSVAGSGFAGFADGNSKVEQFGSPTDVAVDASGALYVSEANRIRILNPDGTLRALAGGGPGTNDGTGSAAQFALAFRIALDSAGNLFVSDANNNRIRKVTPAGVVTTLAGSSNGFAEGQGSAARFSSPYGVAVDASGTVYVADRSNYRIRKVSPDGLVTTFAGSGSSTHADGQGASAGFSSPSGLAFDASGTLYVAESSRVRKVSPSGLVSTLAGSGSWGASDGVGVAASFKNLSDIAVDASGVVYVADYDPSRIRRIQPDGTVSTLAGGTPVGFADGIGAVARFNNLAGIGIDVSGTLYVADSGNRLIRRLR